MDGIVWGLLSLHRQPHETIRIHNYSKGGDVFSYEDSYIDRTFEQLLLETNLARRSELQKAIGNHKFQNYAEMPLFWLKAEVAANPRVVGSDVFPESIAGSFPHLEYVQAAR